MTCPTLEVEQSHYVVYFHRLDCKSECGHIHDWSSATQGQNAYLPWIGNGAFNVAISTHVQGLIVCNQLIHPMYNGHYSAIVCKIDYCPWQRGKQAPITNGPMLIPHCSTHKIIYEAVNASCFTFEASPNICSIFCWLRLFSKIFSLRACLAVQQDWWFTTLITQTQQRS